MGSTLKQLGIYTIKVFVLCRLLPRDEALSIHLRALRHFPCWTVRCRRLYYSAPDRQKPDDLALRGYVLFRSLDVGLISGRFDYIRHREFRR